MPLAELIAASQTIPFLAAQRLIVVENLAARFAPRLKLSVGKKTARAKTPPKDELAPLMEALRNLPPSTELVLTEGKLKDTNVLLKGLRDVARVQQFPPLQERAIPEWVRRRAEEAGAQVTPRAAALLARLVGKNLWTLASEVEKLALYCADRRIEEADVQALASAAREASVFELVDAVFEGKHARAETLVESLLGAGESATGLIMMLHRQLRLILLCREMQRANAPDAAIQSRLGLAWDFQLRIVKQQARRFTRPQIEAAYHRLLVADQDIKTGVYDPDLVLNMLVVELGGRTPAS